MSEISADNASARVVLTAPSMNRTSAIVLLGLFSASVLASACGSNVTPSRAKGGTTSGAGAGGSDHAPTTGSTTAASGGSGGTCGDGDESDRCPDDPFAAAGMPCCNEGLYCGADVCEQICQHITCTGGVWQAGEIFGGPDSDLQSCGGEPTPDGSNFCGDDEWCDYSDDAWCGGRDSTGICKPRPQGACPAECPGVCGCDGAFYCNECTANALGLDVTDENICGG